MNTIKPLMLLIVTAAFISHSSSIFAIDPTSDEPITIESDSATLDDSKGISIYTGNVVIEQGESKLEAERIQVNAENRNISKIIATGQPAHFVQHYKSEETHGYANTITYLAESGTLRLENNAQLQQSNNTFKGELIEYDIAKKAIKAKGNEDTGERVKIEYHPGNPQSNESSPPRVKNVTEATIE